VAALNYLTHIAWVLGYPDQACRLMEEAFEASLQVSHSGSVGQVHYFAGVLFADLRRDPTALQRRLEAMVAFDHEHGFSRVGVAFFQGMSLFECGKQADGLELASESLARMPGFGGERRTYLLCRLAEAYAQSGDTERAWQTVVEAKSMCERTAEHSWDAELHRTAGEVLLAKSADLGEVEARYQQAIRTARQQCAKSLELRAAFSLAHLLISRGKRAEAHDLLAPIYTWFTEGFESADLRKARALLVELSA